MTFDRFDVVVTLFPFTDMEQSKPRPVLVLSAAIFNEAHDHIIGAMITTGAGSRWNSDVDIADLAAAGLNQSCVLRWKIFTLPVGLVAKRIGRLADADQQRIGIAQRDAIG
jgi:mRNA-degrading endonuclease toxin of MazEF toxin-antitoxin module